MQHISTEQALQIPQHLKQHDSHDGSSPHSSELRNKNQLLSDDAVTLLHSQNFPDIKNLKVESFKNEIGQEKSFINETLKNKLSEYQISHNTRLSIEKNNFGALEAKGSVLQSDLEKISIDLNNNIAFKDAFSKLSQQEPTLQYVDNVVKIASAYGVSNNLFNSLISDKNELNQLNDIAHRYEALKTTSNANSNANVTDTVQAKSTFKFTLNA
mgnify:FL=1